MHAHANPPRRPLKLEEDHNKPLCLRGASRAHLPAGAWAPQDRPHPSLQNPIETTRNASILQTSSGQDILLFGQQLRKIADLLQTVQIEVQNVPPLLWRNECEFRNTLLTVISEGYRSIEQRVVQNFAVLDIKPLDERQVKEIEPILFHLESNISKPGADLFRREIKNLYILEKHEEIDLILCYQFYHELREKMEARQADLCPEARMLLI